MYKFIKYFSRNYSFVLLGLFGFLAVLNLFHKNYTEFVNNIMFAFFNFLLLTNISAMNYYIDFVAMTLTASTRQMACIIELANLAAPAVGYDKVIAILEKYNIDVKKLWDDFDDKRNRKLRKRLEIPVPDWVTDLKQKVSQEMAHSESN